MFNKLMFFCNVLGNWMIFVFTFYQGLLEMSNQIERVEKAHHHVVPPKVSAWYWIWPPLKIHLERDRLLRIFKLSDGVKGDLRTMLYFLDRSTAWLYLSVGSLFAAIASNYFTLKVFDIHLTWWEFSLMVLMIIMFVTWFDLYHLKNKRINRKLNKMKEKVKH